MSQTQEEMLLQAKMANFAEQVQLLPQEKIYIQTDKNRYITGEKIFFRAYLVDAMYHIPVSVSRYVYVELINPFDSIVARIKVRTVDNAYYGQLDVPLQWADGAYKLRAYTQFMRNLDETYFFSKIIYIADPNTAKIQLNTQFKIEKNTDVFLNLSLKDLNADPIPFPDEVCFRINGGKQRSVKKVGDSYKLSFSLSANSAQRAILLETTYRGYPYKKFISVPYPDHTYHVSFFPEGGQLLAGTICGVAFKALKSNGLAENVTGKIKDDNGNILAEFATVHSGMGLFNLNVQAGKTYYAECTSEEGVSLKFKLPQVQQNTYALKIKQIRNEIYVSVNKAANTPQEPVYLFLHSRGQILYAEPWNSELSNLAIETAHFTSGIYHFILLNSRFIPISERLVFVNNNDKAGVILNTQQLSYQAREQVIAKVQLTDGEKPVAGSFSVAVTDNNEVQMDSTTNILINLLLTSELRGTVENPAAYFNPTDKKAMYKLDILMQTQGWRRYDVTKAMAGNFTTPKFEVESSQKIAGLVTGGLLLKKIEKAQVSLLSKENLYSKITETDAAGHFAFEKIEFPDSTEFLVQALSSKGSYRMILTMEEDSFPSVIPWIYPQENINDEMWRKYLYKEEQKYIYEKGVRMVNLDDIEVVAQRKEETRSAYTAYADQSLTSDQIEKVGGLTVKKLLERIGTVTVEADGTVAIRRKSPVMLLVNDVETDLVYLDDIDPYDVLRIDVMQSTSAFGQRSANGVISISTKSLQGISDKPRFNLANIKPLGYHVPVEFYAPVYDTPEKQQSTIPDLRTTIHWQPNVQVDETGTAVFDFYTADNKTFYTILLEGITTNGQIIHYKGIIENK